MESEQVREKFLDFFRQKGHVIVPSSSLISDDPSVLLTTAGMQQFKPYYTGEKDPLKDVHPNLGRPLGSKNTASIQKSFRTSDIESIGDETHLTFFEMLGNFSFGGYFKREAIHYAYQFVTEELGLPVDYVTIFGGDPSLPSLPADDESAAIWRAIDPTLKIVARGREDNFWGPTGTEGPCGPTTEIYVKDIEIWNLVFNQFYCQPDGALEELKTPGVDTGMGFERLMAVMNGLEDVFAADLLFPIKEKIEELTPALEQRIIRIFTDHIRAIVFLVADGVRPSNKGAGYILRRLLRRTMAYQIIYDVHPDLFLAAVPAVTKKFGQIYPNLKESGEILTVIDAEVVKFKTALGRGLKELGRFRRLTSSDAFKLYESYGLPFELIKELAPAGAAADLRQEDFEEEFRKHQAISRRGAEKKFGGHGLLLDTGELRAMDEAELDQVTKLHTATHLLQAALRRVLGDDVRQMGSDITAERTRFDFSFPRKLTAEEIKQVETLVNQAIRQNLPVRWVEMPLAEAKKTGALFMENEEYPERVKIYYIGDSLENAFSKEFCGGPHVTETGVIGQFVIRKEEAVSSGIRRIRAQIL
jgi:alanyl-tRNA synthetase